MAQAMFLMLSATLFSGLTLQMQSTKSAVLSAPLAVTLCPQSTTTTTTSWNQVLIAAH